MKQLPLSSFHQAFSLSMDNRPKNVWVIDLETEGVDGDLLERCAESSTGWVGWGFLIAVQGTALITSACLLFEREEDAIMAKLVYGEQLYAN
jgi:hypothetical protein